ncbi:unnamed protein product [Prorocentrum cordatum]|uniref:Uncharacterized protein n=1 Tax=Prorocentrum cordatum TaxID=2364126 RepID=A0ABN9VS34_9DINO|nr:unnamed protein product [Polarella glacialis]
MSSGHVVLEGKMAGGVATAAGKGTAGRDAHAVRSPASALRLARRGRQEAAKAKQCGVRSTLEKRIRELESQLEAATKELGRLGLAQQGVGELGIQTQTDLKLHHFEVSRLDNDDVADYEREYFGTLGPDQTDAPEVGSGEQGSDLEEEGIIVPDTDVQGSDLKEGGSGDQGIDVHGGDLLLKDGIGVEGDGLKQDMVVTECASGQGDDRIEGYIENGAGVLGGDPEENGIDARVTGGPGVVFAESTALKEDGVGIQGIDAQGSGSDLAIGPEQASQDKWVHKWKGQMSFLTDYDDGTVVAGGVYLEMVDRIKGALMTAANPKDVLVHVEAIAKEVQRLAEVHIKLGRRAEARRLITDGLGFARLSENLAGR